ncbi:MAG: LPXTG cell wall anchor domain-containing protein [Actinomycetia bacterium]|nr:LPXTG cell wall anchor domain-containing protein [Actinomycetes bacterium]
MKSRGLIATAAFIVVSLSGLGRASAADLGTFTVGDLISMPKSCAATDPLDPPSDFADLHIVSGHHPAWSLGIDPQITSFSITASTASYSYDTTAQGVGDFTVIIHCWNGDPHDPISQEYIYTFTVAAAAATTTTSTTTPTVAGPGAPTATTTTVPTIPKAGTSSTTTLALLGAALTLTGMALLLVRRRAVA